MVECVHLTCSRHEKLYFTLCLGCGVQLKSVEFFIQHLCHSSLNPSVAMKAKYALNYVRYVEHEKMNLKTCFRSVCEER